jgi:serine/threonine-protein kinase
MGFFIAAVLITGILLARRNMKSGRSDRRGAFRLLLFFVMTMLASWIVLGVQLRTLNPGSLFEELVFGRALGHALVHAVFAWLMYIALEPYVRRLWPETLVSWTRLLMGRYRDPLVGRDLLAGVTLGILLMTFATWLEPAARILFGFPQRLPNTMSFASQGSMQLRDAIGGTFIMAESSVYLPMVLLLVLLLLRVLLRRTWAAAFGFVVVFGGMATLGNESAGGAVLAWEFFGAALFSGAFAYCALRFGLLAAMGLFLTTSLNRVPVTADLSNWYAVFSLWVLAMLAGLAIYSFTLVLAGRPLFRKSLLDS